MKLTLISQQLIKNRGVIYERTGNYYDALNDFNKALEIDPSNKILLVNRSKANYMNRYYKNALNDCEEAMSHGIQIDPKFVEEIKRMLGGSKIDPNKQKKVTQTKDIELVKKKK